MAKTETVRNRIVGLTLNVNNITKHGCLNYGGIFIMTKLFAVVGTV